MMVQALTGGEGPGLAPWLARMLASLLRLQASPLRPLPRSCLLPASACLACFSAASSGMLLAFLACPLTPCPALPAHPACPTVLTPAAHCLAPRCAALYCLPAGGHPLRAAIRGLGGPQGACLLQVPAPACRTGAARAEHAGAGELRVCCACAASAADDCCRDGSLARVAHCSTNPRCVPLLLLPPLRLQASTAELWPERASALLFAQYCWFRWADCLALHRIAPAMPCAAACLFPLLAAAAVFVGSVPVATVAAALLQAHLPAGS